MNKNDEIREAILRYFYDLLKKAPVVLRAKANEMMLIKALASKNFSRQDVISNLVYLTQAGWIKPEKISGVSYYIINDKGVDHFEGTSTFQESHWVTGINVTNVQGVTVIGDHNFVHQEFNELYKQLDLLQNEISKSGSLSDQDKLNYQSEIDTIKSQLAKQSPNKTIIQQSWNALSALSTIPGIVQFYQMIAPIISHLIR